VLRQQWTLRAVESPRVFRRCGRCEEKRPFVSSEKFRVNAQKRRIDVWLIYRCRECNDTWNCEVIERAAPERIGPETLDRFLKNDAAEAWRRAFDLAAITRQGVELERSIPYTIERPVLSPGHLVRVEIELLDPICVRLDALLARALAVSRGRVRESLERGEIQADPRCWAKPVRSGQHILFAPRQPILAAAADPAQ
jgi:hypothetical protein